MSTRRSSESGWARRSLAELPLVAAVVFGALVRLDQILDQVVADDEWHALRAQHLHGYRWILSHFGSNDFCIPLTAYYRLLADTVGLSELGMRMPVLVAGTATVPVLALLARGLVGKSTSDVFAWLLAISPALVRFSRFARPYGIVLLLALVAVAAAWRWRERGERRWAWTYVGCAVLAPYFQPIYLPLVLAPLLGFALTRARGPLADPGAPRLRDVGRLAVAVAACLALLLGPPLVHDVQALSRKWGEDRPVGVTFLVTFELLSGTGSQGLQLAIAGGIAAGAVGLWRRAPRPAAYLAWCLACQLGAVALASPRGIRSGLVLLRYVLPVVPVALLLLAVALRWLDERVHRGWRRWPAGALSGLAVVLLLARGPLPAIHYRPNAWTNHRAFHAYYRGEPGEPGGGFEEWSWRGGRPIPSFYLELAREPPGSLVIVEAPRYYHWKHVLRPAYQRVHRQHVRIGFTNRGPWPATAGSFPHDGEGRYAFRNFVDVRQIDDLRERDVRFVVLRKRRETARGRPGPVRPDVRNTAALYRQRCGAPWFEDEEIVVFDVRY